MTEVQSKLVTIGRDAHEDLVKQSYMLQALIQVGVTHWDKYPEALKVVGDQVPVIMPEYTPEPVVVRGRPVEPTPEEIEEIRASGGISVG